MINDHDPSTSITGVQNDSDNVKPGTDPVFRPSHYTVWQQEPITFLFINNIPFAEGCVIKYVMRWRYKNGVEDLRKAMRFLEMMIEMEENKDKFLAERTCL